MFQELVKKCLKLAAHKSSKFFLGLVSFIESSFFPIPPDIMIIPMVIAKKVEYIKIFLIATFFSVLGGLFGYFLGATFIEIATGVINFYGYENQINTFQENMSSKEGVLLWLGTLFLAGFTPLPYKVFTIASGMINFNIFIFIVISLFARGLRFFIVAYLTKKYGEKFLDLFNQKGTKWFTILGLIILLVATTIYFIVK
tara:strand:- start:783 stop:1379 length:597 start_codon:yes stop_codon:yes gene_type:complete